MEIESKLPHHTATDTIDDTADKSCLNEENSKRQNQQQRIGQDKKFAIETLNNAKVTKNLEKVIQESKANIDGCDKNVGQNLQLIATKQPPDSTQLMRTNRYDLYKYVIDKSLRTTSQMNAALNYFRKNTTFDKDAFEKETGVGIVVTKEQISQAIDTIINNNYNELSEERYRVTGKQLSLLMNSLKWADGAIVSTMFSDRITKLLGPKTEQDMYAVKKNTTKDKVQLPPAALKVASAIAATTTKIKEMEINTKIQSPNSESEKVITKDDLIADISTIANDDSFMSGRDLEWARNDEETLNHVREKTKGLIITRFPPEPNGYQHIGHAKAMAQNFGLAEAMKGICIMRFDDTNPEAENEEYITNILKNQEQLGYKPDRITYSSDYFNEQYELAIKQIKKNKAYVCHQTKEEIKRDRDIAQKTGKCPESPYRNRDIETNQRLFNDMKDGKLKENECTLRMKGDLNHPNPNMWDTVFYRIRYTPHPHVGDRWCIYPTYDYTHCIIDSLEYITYSMCTLEFEVRRESYYWQQNEQEQYKPKVWEYSRLNITYNVLSKRLLRKLVEDNYVRGWNDPRQLTLNGQFRRGIPPKAINEFIYSLGISRNASVIPIEKLYISTRNVLNPISTRMMVVINPLLVKIINFNDIVENSIEYVDIVEQPGIENLNKTHKAPLTDRLYIEYDDFMVKPTSNFLRLSVGRQVRLKHSYTITCERYDINDNNIVTCVYVRIDKDCIKKPKTSIHWVASPDGISVPETVEVRLYNTLFKSPEPMSVSNWVDDLNPESEIVCKAYVEPYLKENVKMNTPYQFERLGYFILDPDTDMDKKELIFNRICELRRSAGVESSK